MNNDPGNPGTVLSRPQGGLGGCGPLDGTRLFAFVAAGTVWIAGASLGLSTGPVLALIASAYVLPGSLAVALARERTGMMLVVLWGCAVVLMSALTIPVAGVWAVVPGVLFGTVCFGAWTGTGFLLVRFFTPNTRTDL